MNRLYFTGLAAVVSATLAASSHAAVVDGSRDVAYGPALAVQAVPTGFGDSISGTNSANGSELDAAYAQVSGGRLYLFFAGNLESNFNKLDVFIASGGGSNVVGTLSNNQGNYNNMSGMTFDAGFNASRWISVTNGNASPDIYVDYGDLVAGNGFYAGQTTPGVATLTGGSMSAPNIELTLNNTNTAGVTSSSVNSPENVTTGIELSIALADLGYTSGDILVTAFINNTDHNYASNQFLGSLPAGTGNLGGNGSGGFTGSLSGVNLQNFAGNQYFTVAVPEPATLSALALLGALARRRK